MAVTAPTPQALASYMQLADPPAYAVPALDQAHILFEMAMPCVTEEEISVVESSMVQYAQLDMAERLVYSKPYAQTAASPFRSETIGSYSYSRYIGEVTAGHVTGVPWFDAAMAHFQCGVDDEASFGSTSVSVFERDVVYDPVTGDTAFLSPSEMLYYVADILPWALAGSPTFIWHGARTTTAPADSDFVVLTQAEYNLLSPPDPDTLYVVIG